MPRQQRPAGRLRAATAVAGVVLATWVAAAPADAVTPPGSPTSAGAHSAPLTDKSGSHGEQHTGQRSPRWERHVEFQRRDWGLPTGEAVPWDSSPQSVDRLVHLAGLVMGSALLLGGFRRGRPR